MIRSRIAVSACLLVLASAGGAARAQGPQVCVRQEMVDPSSDVDATLPIDVKSITVRSDCRTLTFTLTARSPFTDAELDVWNIWLSPRKTDWVGCGSMKQVVSVFAADGGGLKGVVEEVSSCSDIHSPFAVTARRINRTSISVTLPRSVNDYRSFRWQSYLWGSGSDDPDATPTIAPTLTPDRRFGFRLWLAPNLDRTGITVDWLIDSFDADLVDRVVLQYRRGSGEWSRPIFVRADQTQFDLTGLTPDRTYTVRLAAERDGVRGDWSQAKIHFASAPGAPRRLRVTSSGSWLVLRFDPPRSDGGWPIEGYDIVSRWDGGEWTWTTFSPATEVMVQAPTFPATIWLRVHPPVNSWLVPWAKIVVPEAPPAEP